MSNYHCPTCGKSSSMYMQFTCDCFDHEDEDEDENEVEEVDTVTCQSCSSNHAPSHPG